MAVRGSRTGRPVMKVLDVLGRRWSLRILWELRNGPLSFRALQAACDQVSPSSLNRRLAELRDLGVVESRDEAGYDLTRGGGELVFIMLRLHRWAERHLVRPQSASPAAKARRPAASR
jgi:DNA-binding HxlR family transcriptional regulator